jgi:hypothetical protein
MAEAVYILCAIAGTLCAALLARAYSRTPSRLLLWSSVCFTALALNALLVVADMVVLPHSVDLRTARLAVAGVGVLSLLWALITDSN